MGGKFNKKKTIDKKTKKRDIWTPDSSSPIII